jgi:hypothetical protein
MFIAWRKRPVVGNKKIAFLTDIRTPSGDRDPWKPLYCNHRGEGRIAWTPLVMHSERRDSKPRQKVLERFPTIRSCCIVDGFNRAAWWHQIDCTIAGWVEADLDPMYLLIARDRPSMIAKLKEVVPRPTPAGLLKFERLKAEKEREQKEWMDAYFAKLREETERRRREGEFSQDEEYWYNAFKGFGVTKKVAEPDCFAVLGMDRTATLDEVKVRFRELAMTHHPDKGGDAKEFVRYQMAYERACETSSG